MVQIKLVVPKPNDKERIEEIIYSPLKSIDNGIILKSFDPETGIVELESFDSDDVQYNSFGDLFNQWLADADPPILNYNLIRGSA